MFIVLSCSGAYSKDKKKILEVVRNKWESKKQKYNQMSLENQEDSKVVNNVRFASGEPFTGNIQGQKCN